MFYLLVSGTGIAGRIFESILLNKLFSSLPAGSLPLPAGAPPLDTGPSGALEPSPADQPPST